MPDKFKSRKFWFALLGAVLPVVASTLTGEVALEQAITLSVGILASYILGQGYVDGQSAAVAAPEE